jgi:hypothetical protein
MLKQFVKTAKQLNKKSPGKIRDFNSIGMIEQKKLSSIIF